MKALAIAASIVMGGGVLTAAGADRTPADDGRARPAVSAGAPQVVRASPTLSVTLLRDGEYFPRLLKEIRGAAGEIVIGAFLFRTGGREGRPDPRESAPDVLVGELAAAVKRGVRVLAVLERSRDPKDTVTSDNRETAARLRNAGVEVYFDSPRRRSHEKVVVIDSRLTFLGSHNLTEAALRFNHELSVLIDSEEFAGAVKRAVLALRK